MPYKKYPAKKNIQVNSESAEKKAYQVCTDDFARPFIPGTGISEFSASLPRVGDADQLNALCAAVKAARKEDCPVVMALGESVYEQGLLPVIIELMERGWVSAIMMNDRCMERDFETALLGKTVEKNSTEKNRFSITEETGLFLNIAMKERPSGNAGLGETTGRYLTQTRFPFNDFSVIYRAYRLNIPVTVHSISGFAGYHMHPHFNPGVLGELNQNDNLLLSAIIMRMDQGGLFWGIDPGTDLWNVFLRCLDFNLARDCMTRNIDCVFLHAADNPSPYRSPRNLCAARLQIAGPVGVLFPLVAAMLVS